MTIWKNALSAAALVAVCFSAGCGEDDTPPEWTADGVWAGDWTSDRGFGGTTTVTMIQEGQVLSGTAVLAGAPCLSEVRFEGTIDSETNAFSINLIDDADPTKDFLISGFIFPEQEFMDAEYVVGNWGVCSGSSGLLGANRQ